MTINSDTKVVIFGATSAIARATARNFASAQAQLLLVGRREEALEHIKEDLIAYGASKVEVEVADLSAIDQLSELVLKCWRVMGGEVDLVLVAQGSLPNQLACQADTDLAMKEFQNNGTAPVALCNLLAIRFEKQTRGTLAVITSVAADRGREVNYLYGAAKAALSTYVDGLHVRFSKKGIRVVNIKPGYVSTPMTAHLKQGVLFAKPEDVGRSIFLAMTGKRDGTFYVPAYWRAVLFVVRHVPESIFKRFRI